MRIRDVNETRDSRESRVQLQSRNSETLNSETLETSRLIFILFFWKVVFFGRFFTRYITIFAVAAHFLSNDVISLEKVNEQKIQVHFEVNGMYCKRNISVYTKIA